MPRRSTLAKVPLAPRHLNLRFGSLWSRGWESNPLQPSIPGCLLRVATRCFCSPSPEPIGLRWTVPTPASCPRQFGPSSSEPYKLVEKSKGLSRLSEYLVPYFAGYLSSSFFGSHVSDQESACLEDGYSVILSGVGKY